MKKYFLTDEQISRLVKIYPTSLTQDIADEFCVSIYCIRNLAFNMKLKKSKEWVVETARARSKHPNFGGQKTRFKKGIIPKNKGKKQHEYMSAEAIEKTIHTRFKDGHTPANHKPIGYERYSKDGYLERKTDEPSVFKAVHRIVWEQHHGKIKKGFNIQFKDGNKNNCDIDNLYIISRQEQLKEENSMYARYPKDMQLLIHAKGR